VATGTAQAVTGYHTSRAANVRAAPNSGSAIIASLPAGAAIGSETPYARFDPRIPTCRTRGQTRNYNADVAGLHLLGLRQVL
jgi:hypothetical protein